MRTLMKVALLATVAITARALAAEKAQTAGEVYSSFEIGPLKAATLRKMESGVIAKVGDTPITKKHLEGKLAEAPEEDHKLLRPFLLAQIVQRQMLLAEAKKKGMVKEKGEKEENRAINEMVAEMAAAVAISEEEINQVYEHNKAQFAGADPEEAKTTIKGFLLQRKRNNAITQYFTSLWAGVEVAIDQQWATEQHKQASDNPIDKARESGKITLIDFGSESCGPCRRLAPILRQIQQDRKDVNIITVDVDKQRALAIRYGIRNLPTIIVFDARGKQVSRSEGLLPKEQIIAKITEAAARQED